MVKGDGCSHVRVQPKRPAIEGSTILLGRIRHLEDPAALRGFALQCCGDRPPDGTSRGMAADQP